MGNNTELPALAAEAPGRPKDTRYKEQFGVIVICKTEAEHKKVYERLYAQGYKCRAVRT
ncbi:hypothetical protein [Halodesulfovibrio aestuarii]|uniref:hypothetical protein n=1 Tax=Halodesulfovibrio aestuarii TaxID=126333 RepID=UPI003D35596F